MTGLLLQYERWLFYVQAIALAAVIVRMSASGLYRIYRFFFCYLLVQVAQLSIPFLVPRTKTLYGYAYLGTEAIIVVFYALIILELYTLVLKDLRGIATTSKRYIKVALTIAIASSLLILTWEHASLNLLAQFYIFERTIVSSLVVFVVLITVFLAYYPIPLHRNVIYYSIGYAVYFTSKAVALFLRNTGHQWDLVFSIVVLATSTGCLLFWTTILSRQGETKPMVVGRQRNPVEAARVLSQLEAINAILLRARK